MRIKGILMAVAFGLSSWAAAAPIKIVSWNIEWFPGKFPDATPHQQREHMAEVRYALRRIRPDVLILLEMRNPDVVRQAIKSLPGMQLNAISSFEGRPQQIAIASRFPVRRGGQAPWVRFFTGPPRGFTFAELALPDRKCLQVYGVHLKSNRGAQIINRSFREISAIQLSEFIGQLTHDGTCPSAGVVVGGDFNTNLDDEKFADDDSLRYLIGAGMYWPFASLKPDARKTWQGDDNFDAIQFDHFVTMNVGAPVAQILKTGRISDHLPIEIVIDTDDIKTGSAALDVPLAEGRPAP